MQGVKPPFPGLPFYENLAPQPPPAHMGIPPVHIDPKTGANFSLKLFIVVIKMKMLITVLVAFHLYEKTFDYENYTCKLIITQL